MPVPKVRRMSFLALAVMLLAALFAASPALAQSG